MQSGFWDVAVEGRVQFVGLTYSKLQSLDGLQQPDCKPECLEAKSPDFGIGEQLEVERQTEKGLDLLPTKRRVKQNSRMIYHIRGFTFLCCKFLPFLFDVYFQFYLYDLVCFMTIIENKHYIQ